MMLFYYNKEKKKNYIVNIVEEKLKHWTETTTTHGISHAARSTTMFFRIFWILFFLGSFGYCTYTIVLSFIKYYSYETTVSISRIHELPAPYPAVTLCNLNPFNEQFSNLLFSTLSTKISGVECFNLTNANAFQKCFKKNNTNDAIEDFITQMKRATAVLGLTSAGMSYFGYDIKEDMLISCQFNGIECDLNLFVTSWSNKYGRCYTFNSALFNNKTKFTSLEGDKYGLKIELVVKPNPQNVTTKFDFETGLYLVVHDQSALPYTVMKHGIKIPTGLETFIGIDRNFVNKLPEPYSDCLTNLSTVKSDYAQTLYTYFNSLKVPYYDQEFCFTLCYQERLANTCRCYDLDTPRINILKSIKFCLNDVEVNCLKKFKASFAVSDLNAICQSACKQHCNIRKYNLKTTSNSFPLLNHVKYLQTINKTMKFFPQNVSDEELMDFSRQALVKLNVNYNNLYYTLIEDSPAMTFDDLFGVLGGQLGLFIGLSILSLIELIELIIDIIIAVIAFRSLRYKATHPEEERKQEMYKVYFVAWNNNVFK